MFLNRLCVELNLYYQRLMFNVAPMAGFKPASTITSHVYMVWLFYFELHRFNRMKNSYRPVACKYSVLLISYLE